MVPAAASPAGASRSIRLRLTDRPADAPFGEAFDRVVETRRAEADAFYAKVIPAGLSPDGRNVMRQALAGMLWSKQYYGYDVARWLKGDPDQPAPPPERKKGRNAGWQHLYNADVLSMPDTWEYPWYAAWDLAFHTIPLALVDPDFAKAQLVLLLREWYMHPNGQLPAYEWKFSDVNPPVHAWAAWRVYKIDAKRSGKRDREFLVRVFHKLLLNFTWWVNRKDTDGNNVFQGGFLGLDNIGIFDRSKPLPFGATLQQSDATSWMGMYCLNMGTIALELAREDRAYQDIASKFFEHFMYISKAMNAPERGGTGLWDEQDGFFYDNLCLPDGRRIPMRIQSMVGLIPLFAVETLEPFVLEAFPGFRRRMQWFLDHGASYGARVETETTAAGTPAPPLVRGARPAPAHPRAAPRPRALPLGPRDPVALEGAPRAPVRHSMGRPRAARRLRAGRVLDRPLRRQLELAGAGLVPRELPPHRVPPEVPPLLRGLVHRRVPDRLRPRNDPLGRRRGALPSPDADLPGAVRTAGGPRTGGPRRSRPTRTGGTSSSSTSTSTGTTARGSGPRTRRAGRASSPSSFSRTETAGIKAPRPVIPMRTRVAALRPSLRSSRNLTSVVV